MNCRNCRIFMPDLFRQTLFSESRRTSAKRIVLRVHYRAWGALKLCRHGSDGLAGNPFAFHPHSPCGRAKRNCSLRQSRSLATSAVRLYHVINYRLEINLDIEKGGLGLDFITLKPLSSAPSISFSRQRRTKHRLCGLAVAKDGLPRPLNSLHAG